MIQWNPSPVLWQIGPFALRWYSLMFIIGFWTSVHLMKKIFIWEKYTLEKIDSLLFHVFLGTLIGARLGHVLFYDPVYYFSHPLDILKVWEGGLASHGGTLGVILSVVIFCRKNSEFSLMWLFDRVSMLAIMTGSLIRIGNLMNSEIVGQPTQVPWSFVFTRVDQLPRHPTQIYESVCYAIIFLVCWFVYLQKKESTPKGLLFGMVLVGTFSVRLFLEFLKENQEAFEQNWILNMGQILSLPFILCGLFLVFRALKKNI